MQCYSRSQVGKTVVVTSDHDQEDSIWLVLLQTTGGRTDDRQTERTELIPILWRDSVDKSQ